MSPQEERVLFWLSDGSWHCAREALAEYLYTFSQRISEINARQPGRIVGRSCQQHKHKLFEYVDTFMWTPQQVDMSWAKFCG